MLSYSRNFEENIFRLRESLVSLGYSHDLYKSFFVCDPKRRHIHKASLDDRVVHRAVFRVLDKIFDKTFIYDSYSSRKDKGVHKAINRFRNFARKLAQNNTKKVWILKCDVRKFFDSIDHGILIHIISSKINDENVLWLIKKIVYSFNGDIGRGLPLGNLTSQLFANVYLNELDQFIKRDLRVKYYIRYADDFVIMSRDKKWLEEVLFKIKEFLYMSLKLELHPNKVSIETLSSGVDFLGWVNFLDYRVLRTTTKRRMFRNIREKNGKLEVLQSYLGLLSHGNGKILQGKVASRYPPERTVRYGRGTKY